MDRRTRRDVGVASVIGASLVVATLGVGHVFTPSGSSTVEGGSGGDRGGALVLAGGDRVDGRRTGGAGRETTDGGTPAGTVPTATSGPTPTAGPGAGGTGTGTTGGGSGSDAADDSGIGASAAGGTGSDGGGTGGGATDGGAAGGGTGDATPGGGDGTVTTAGVRLRVTDLSVTGTDSGTLKAGSEVRVRLSARRVTTSTGTDTSSTATVADRSAAAAGVGLRAVGETADPDGATAHDPAGEASDAVGTGDATGTDDALPERLDVRIRLDDDAVAALGRTSGASIGPVALRALVDLVDGPDAAEAGPYRVRVRMQLAPAQATRAAVADAGRASDGVSNVVAVTTPIGSADPTTSDPGDDAATVPATGDPVEVLVPVPPAAGTSSPADGANVGVPIPPDTTSPGGDGPSTADAAVVVHVPDADEPIGGTPEDLSTAPPAIPTPDPTVPAPGPTTTEPTPDPGASSPDPGAGSGTVTTAPEPPTSTAADDPSTPDAPATTDTP